MKQPIFLKSFEYSVPGSDTDTISTESRVSHPAGLHLPMVKVNIDFEKRNLTLDGNGLLIMASGKTPKRPKSASAKERIRVKASIYPGSTVDLSEFTDKASVFSLEGIIEDGESLNSCSGLLMLDSTTGTNVSGGREWNLTLYLYDDFNEEREIKLKLTMCSYSENSLLN